MNTLKTGFLLVAISALAVALGAAFFRMEGALIGLGLAFVFQAFSYFNGHRMALGFARAQPLAPGQIPWLDAIATQLAQRAGIPTPKLYISPDPQPNAFAAGRNPEHAVVCVNEGLLRAMSQDHVAVVLAHEFGHIKNRDILTMTIAASAASLITFVSHIGWFLGGGDRERNPFVELLALLVAPIAAMMIQLAISRTREFAADRAAAELLGTPQPMISALRRLEETTSAVPSFTARPATAHMYIASPFQGGGLLGLFQTHPPLEARIAALAALGALIRLAEGPATLDRTPEYGT